MIKLASALVITVLLTGCASKYTMEGKVYANDKEFQAAVDLEVSSALNQVKPYGKPLTKKKLVAALPSEQAIFAENAKRHKAATGREIMGLATEQNTNLSRAAYKMTRVFYEGAEKKGIYSSFEIKDMPTMTVSIEPSDDYDVIYFTEPGVGSGQYFYASAKHGKQVFAYDRSGVGVIPKVNAFVDAIQSLAIRE